MSIKSNLYGVTGLLALAIAAQPLQAQDTPQAGEEEAVDAATIVVTARLREEEIQDVPLGINAFNAEEIERQNLVRLDDLALVTAGLTFDIGGFPNDTRPALRGMQAERGRPSVAILLDGQDLSGENLSIAGGTSSLRTDLFDLERIEVVKGPQATLYGRNAFAGAINYITKQPEFEPSARGMVEVAEGGLIRGTASVTGPIIDDILAMRLNIAMKDFDGYYRNPVNGGRLGAEHSEGYAISALFKPDPNLKITTRFQQVKARMSDNPTAFIFSNVRLPVPGGTFAPPGPPGTPMQPCPASLTGLPAATVTACTRGTVVGRISARESNVQMGVNPLTGLPPFGMRSNTRLASAKVEWDTQSFGTFVYSYGFLKDRSLIEQDGDFTSTPAPPGLVLSLNALQNLDYTNEHDDHTLYWLYNSDKLSLVAGMQVFDETSNLRNSSQFTLRGGTASPLAGPPFRLRTAPVANPAFPVLIGRETDYTGYFGGFSYELIEGLRLSAEVRRNKDRILYTSSGQRRQDVSLSNLTPVCIPTIANGTSNTTNPASQSPPIGTIVACPIQTTIRDNRWTPRFTVDYHFNPDVMVYASYAEGFKPGGVNTNEVFSFVGQDYRAETVETIELGLKSAWFDKRLVFNIDVYRNRYKDQQIGVQLTGAGGVTTAGIINAARVDIWGIEADMSWRVADPLTIGFNYAYTDATFDRYVQGPNAGSAASVFAQCGVPVTQSGSTQNLAEAQNICGDFSGKRVGKNPKHSLNGNVTFEQDFGDDNSWFVEATGSYRSKRFVDESNLTFLPSYFIGNLRGGVTLMGKYSLTAYVDNVFDNRRIRSAQRVVDFGNPEGFAPGRGIIAYLPQPRTFGIRFGAEF